MFIDVTFASTAGCSIHMWSKECYLKGDKPSTCLNILAIFLLLQPMLLLTFFATGLCLAGGAHTSSFFFSAKLPISQSQSLCHCRSFFLSRSRTWHLFLLNIIRLLSASYSSLATCPWGYQLVSLTWCHLQIFQDWTPLSSSLLCYICWISKGLVQILAALKFLFIFR